jgi:purine-binding chemotaxis protein CheW
METMKKQTKTLGELLIHAGKITKEQLEEALAEQKTTGEPLGKIMVRRSHVKEEDIMEVLKGMLVVVFEANKESFGLEIVYSREILNNRRITPLPVMPPHIMGMITVRDHVIPVISLNMMIFNVPSNVTEDSKILIIEHMDDAVGVMVDRILSVRNFKSEQFEDLRRSMIAEDKKYMAGIIKDGGEIITLLKAEHFFKGGKK